MLLEPEYATNVPPLLPWGVYEVATPVGSLAEIRYWCLVMALPLEGRPLMVTVGVPGLLPVVVPLLSGSLLPEQARPSAKLVSAATPTALRKKRLVMLPPRGLS